MTINEVFPKFQVPVLYDDLNVAGQYLFKSDCIILDNDLKNSLPAYSDVVLLHEMIHSTASNKRLFRLERLVKKFGSYIEGSLSYRVEECIAEIGCMVACIKLGLYNEYTRNIIIDGIKKNYTSDMYIPVREVKAAVRYFTNDDIPFEEEIQDTIEELKVSCDIKFQQSYEIKKAS